MHETFLMYQQGPDEKLKVLNFNKKWVVQGDAMYLKESSDLHDIVNID